MLRSKAFKELSGTAVKVLLAMLDQYKGSNNGMLTMTLTVMKPFGINSNDVLTRAIDALISSKLVVRTRTGGFMKQPSFYAVTFRAIDDGDHDKKTTNTAPILWAKEPRQ